MHDLFVGEFQKSWSNFLDPEIDVTLFVDDIDQQYEKNRTILDLEKTIPDLKSFKKRNENFQAKKFIDDAIRFSHKSYAICYSGLTSNADFLVWLDADVSMHAPVTTEFLLSHIPTGVFTSYLGRRKFSETGFLAFDLNHSASTDFFNSWKNLYDKDSILLRKGKTDCHAFDATRLEFEEKGLINSLDLNAKVITGNKNAFENVFGEVMKHYKGTSGDLYAQG